VLDRDPESMALAAMEADNRHAREATGATLFGPDTREYPAWWYDVIVTAERYRILENNARSKAEMESLK
jgi:hypothetical protein